MNVSAWRFGVPKARNEFAIASLTMGTVGAIAIMIALVSDGMSGWSVSEPSATQMARELAARFALMAAPCALLAAVLGALGRRFRFAGERLSRGGILLGLVVLVECAALGLGWFGAGVVGH